MDAVFLRGKSWEGTHLSCLDNVCVPACRCVCLWWERSTCQTT